MENTLIFCVRVLPLISGLMLLVSEFLNTVRIVFKDTEINTAVAGDKKITFHKSALKRK